MRSFEERRYGKNIFCEAYQRFFDYAGERLYQIADTLRKTKS